MKSKIKGRGHEAGCGDERSHGEGRSSEERVSISIRMRCPCAAFPHSGGPYNPQGACAGRKEAVIPQGKSLGLGRQAFCTGEKNSSERWSQEDRSLTAPKDTCQTLREGSRVLISGKGQGDDTETPELLELEEQRQQRYRNLCT